MKSIKTQLCGIRKLGEFFRQHYPDWKINQLHKGWQRSAEMYLREINHEAGGQVLAFARVEVPEATFLRFQNELSDLGDRSIGDHFLFLRDDVVRDSFKVFKKESQWTRQSRYLVAGHPLIITEYLTEKGLACLPC